VARRPQTRSQIFLQFKPTMIRSYSQAHKFQVVEAFTIERPIFLPAARIGAVTHSVHPAPPRRQEKFAKKLRRRIFNLWPPGIKKSGLF
jgi:hypothetical protein